MTAKLSIHSLLLSAEIAFGDEFRRDAEDLQRVADRYIVVAVDVADKHILIGGGDQLCGYTERLERVADRDLAVLIEVALLVGGLRSAFADGEAHGNALGAVDDLEHVAAFRLNDKAAFDRLAVQRADADVPGQGQRRGVFLAVLDVDDRSRVFGRAGGREVDGGGLSPLVTTNV